MPEPYYYIFTSTSVVKVMKMVLSDYVSVCHRMMSISIACTEATEGHFFQKHEVVFEKSP